MKTVGLISGGKDSCYNLMQCISEGHDVVALANLRPSNGDELDSYMFQTVGHSAIDAYAEALGLPLFRRVIEGKSLEIGSEYNLNCDDEVEDLYELLKDVKEKVGIEAVSVGAIFSEYQRVRVENVCARLGLVSLAYLWRRDQEELLDEMIRCQLVAIVIKVASLGLTPSKHLGRTLNILQPHLQVMNSTYGINVCGEGGEYETFTTDCPIFNKRIIVVDSETVIHSESDIAPVAYMNLKRIRLEDKGISHIPLSERLIDLPMKRSNQIHNDVSVNQYLCKLSHCVLAHLNLQDAVLPTICPTQDALNCHVVGLVGEREFGVTVCAVESSCVVDDCARAAMEWMIAFLNDRQMGPQNMCAVHLYLQSMTQFAQVNAIYKTYFSQNPPVRVCVQPCLPRDVCLIMTGLCHPSTSTSPSNSIPRSTMHVQGLSHWAPANIGPYSQAVKVGELVLVAGQIAMIPANLSLLSGGAYPQAVLAFTHVKRIVSATMSSGGLVNALCYVTKSEDIPCAIQAWMEGGTGIDVKCNPLCVIVVPALPKGALVEWHVWASHSDTRLQGEFTEQQRPFAITANFVTSGGHPTTLAISVRIDCALETPVTWPGVMDAVTSAHRRLMALASERLQEQDVEEDESLAEREILEPPRTMYFAQHRLQLGHILKEVCGGMVASFVPVYGFHFPETIAVLTT